MENRLGIELGLFHPKIFLPSSPSLADSLTDSLTPSLIGFLVEVLATVFFCGRDAFFPFCFVASTLDFRLGIFRISIWELLIGEKRWSENCVGNLNSLEPCSMLLR